MQCDKCSGWVHLVCIENLDTSLSGDFFYKFCRTGADPLAHICSAYFDKNYRKSDQELVEIEIRTLVRI